ncbi:MAG: hypothetical protein JST08_03300 [Actinobacteria bacterium]|nr:hypothetical protein [Actinomycetota bacterium]
MPSSIASSWRSIFCSSSASRAATRSRSSSSSPPTSARSAASWRRKWSRRSGPKIRFEMKESARAITRSSRTYCHLPWPLASAAVSP